MSSNSGIVEEATTLPHDDLVEIIISMLPFPAMFQALCLSKTWKARFSSAPADDEEARRCLVHSFHQKAIELSRTWGTIWPLFTSKGILLGYDRAFQIWRTMPSLSFLPEAAGVPQALCAPLDSPVSGVQIEGALLFLWAKKLSSNCKIYLANILTRSWKTLPLPPLLTEIVFYRKLVIGKSSKAYKVILLGYLPDWDREHRELVSIQIYDSELDTWRRNFLKNLDWNFNPSTAVHLDGILYTVSSSTPPLFLLAYNLEDGIKKHIALAASVFRLPRNFQIEAVKLVTDKAGLLMIVTVWDLLAPRCPYYQEDGSYSLQWKHRLIVLRIDLRSGRVLQLAHSPLVHIRLKNTECIMDRNCIIFGLEESGSRQVVQYNVDTNEWNHFQSPPGYKWLGYCFEPGMNPFIAV